MSAVPVTVNGKVIGHIVNVPQGSFFTMIWRVPPHSCYNAGVNGKYIHRVDYNGKDK